MVATVWRQTAAMLIVTTSIASPSSAQWPLQWPAANQTRHSVAHTEPQKVPAPISGYLLVDDYKTPYLANLDHGELKVIFRLDFGGRYQPEDFEGARVQVLPKASNPVNEPPPSTLPIARLEVIEAPAETELAGLFTRPQLRTLATAGSIQLLMHEAAVSHDRIRKLEELYCEVEGQRQLAEKERQVVEARCARLEELIRDSYQETQNLRRLGDLLQGSLNLPYALVNPPGQDANSPEVFNGLPLSLVKGKMAPPVVQLNGDDSVGSAALVDLASLGYRAQPGEYHLLTANHVVRNILSGDIKAREKGIEAIIYQGANKKITVLSKMIANDPDHDLALMQFTHTDAPLEQARLIPPDLEALLDIGTAVYPYGCPLGNDPVFSAGYISQLDNQVYNTSYWMINAPTYFGNSGGPIYVVSRDLRTPFIAGIFSKIYTHGRGTPTVVTHLGLMVPPREIFAFLARTGFAPNLPGAAPAANLATLQRPLPEPRELALPTMVLRDH